MTNDAETGALILEARSSLVGSFRRAPRSANEAMQPVAPPPPPEPKKREHGRLVVIGSAIFTFLLLAIVVIAGGIDFLATKLHEPGPLAADTPVVVRGNSASEIADTLLTEKVIDNGLFFAIGVRVLGVAQRLHKGEFQFQAHASIESVIDTLVEGKSIDRSVTIPEGKTSEEVVAILKANEFLSGDIKEVPREGTLMPDTYKFTRGDPRSKLLAWMAEAQRAALGEIWKRRSQDLPIHSAQELVILASIVEKETSRADERPRIAGLFMNRLQKNMRLQSDPTIIYGLTGGKGPLGHGLTKDEIVKPTPYNTYTIDGLPPGPIANPGRAAMESVANPSRTRELYFVADGTGGHVFAETLDQHNRNVARWRQIEADRAAAAASGAAPSAPGSPAPAAAPGTPAPIAGSPPTGAAAPTSPAPSAASPAVVPRFAAPGSQTPGGAPPPGPSVTGSPSTPSPSASPAQPPGQPLPKKPKRGAAKASPTEPDLLPDNASALAEPETPVRGGKPGVGAYPLSPAMRAKLARDAAAAGVKLAPTAPLDPTAIIDPAAPADGSGDAAGPAAPAVAPAGTPQPATATPPHRGGFDAVAGTAKDPLNNKTFDLNFPKTVPNLK